MNFKNRNLALLKSLGLSEKQRNLKHSKQRTLKRSLFQLFQLSLFVSAFVLQISDHLLFEFDSPFKQSCSSEMTSVSGFSSLSTSSSQLNSFHKNRLSKSSFAPTNSFELTNASLKPTDSIDLTQSSEVTHSFETHPIFKRVFSFFNSKTSLHFKVNLFVFNTAYGASSKCTDNDNLSALHSKNTELEEKLSQLNTKISSLEDRHFRESLQKEKLEITNEKSNCENLIEQKEAEATRAEEELEENFECSEDDNIKKIDEKITNIESLKTIDYRDRATVSEADTFKKAFNLETNDQVNDKIHDFLSRVKRECEQLKTDREKGETECKEATEKFGEAKSDFRKNCGAFVQSGAKCEEFITGCAFCSSPEDKNDSYDCVKIHKKSQCPELAGPELEKARELVEDYEEKKKDIIEELQELQEDLLKAEEELNQDLVEDEEEFNESVSDFKKDTENSKEDLDSSFHSARQNISENLNEQIAEVQKAIDSQLAIAHSFENALTKAHREYSLEVQKINRECRAEALTRLMEYRNIRRMAIQNGAYTISFSQLLDKKRANFQQQDQARLRYYDKSCRKDRKQDFRNVELKYKDTLRGIEQKKIEYQAGIENMRKRLAILMKQASSQEQSLIQQYVKGMSENINKFEAGYKNSLGNYNKRKQSLIFNGSKTINRLKALIAAKSQELGQMEKSLVQQKGLVSYLKSKGVSDEEDNHDSYSDLSASLGSYDLSIERNWSACNCEEDDSNTGCPNKKTYKRMMKRTKDGGNR